VKTYCAKAGVSVEELPYDGGSGLTVLYGEAMDADVACVAVQHPNFLGLLEPVGELTTLAHDYGALLAASVDPISLGVLKPPAEYGADIVVGEGQALGLPPGFGGPLLGIFACRESLVRRMPGRVVGRTVDAEGETAYCLTLQTREQHIRRERATSNICTNEALCALAAGAYLAALGREGLRETAELCAQKAHYAFDAICALDGFDPVFSAPFFQEFVVRCPGDAAELRRRLLKDGILAGLPLGRYYPELGDDTMLFCVTEQRTREEIDGLVDALGSR
jgi:glycine dehydrogenase subunit 1